MIVIIRVTKIYLSPTRRSAIPSTSVSGTSRNIRLAPDRTSTTTSPKRKTGSQFTLQPLETTTIWSKSEEKRPTNACMVGGRGVGGRHRRRAAPPEPDRPEKQHGRVEGGQKHKQALVGAADPGTTATGPSGASAAGNGAGRRRRRERRRRRLQHAGWVEDRRSANRRRRSGGLFKIDSLSQIQFTDFVENYQPTARSTSPPSAMNSKATKGCHGFTFRHTSLKKADCASNRKQNEVGRRHIGT